MKPLITICARKGSKRLPGKHLRLLHGKPLIWWTLDQAFRWGKGHVLLSTDDNEIAEYARGVFPDVTMVWQRRNYEPDATPKIDVIRNAAEDYGRLLGEIPKVIMDLDCCNPIREMRDLDIAFDLYKKHEPPSVVSVTEARRNPWFNQLHRTTWNKLASPCGGMVVRSQDAPEVFDINCCIYVYRRDFLLDKANVKPYCSESVVYIMAPWTFCDIDDSLDFDLVEFLMGKYLFGVRNEQI